MLGASWLASTRSLALKFKSGASSLALTFRSGVSSSKAGLSHGTSSMVPSSGDTMISGGHARDKGYLELHDIGHLGDHHHLGSVRTEIRGEGAALRSLEEGVVHKTVDVHQSTMQERSAA